MIVEAEATEGADLIAGAAMIAEVDKVGGAEENAAKSRDEDKPFYSLCNCVAYSEREGPS